VSPIALGLDLILAILLVSALIVGLRLNAKLKTLQAGQAGFVKAAVELNQAAARADAGLSALRAAAEEVHDGLLSRIETARQLTARLEGAVERAPALAAAAAPPAEPGLRMPQAGANAPIRFTPRPVKSAIRDMDDDLFEAPPSRKSR
jgi:hypothetical protein